MKFKLLIPNSYRIETKWDKNCEWECNPVHKNLDREKAEEIWEIAKRDWGNFPIRMVAEFELED